MKIRSYEELKPLLQQISQLNNRLDSGEITKNEFVKLRNKAIKYWKKESR